MKRSSLHPGNAGSAWISQKIQIQDAHTCISDMFSAPRRLVHFSPPEGCIYPHSHLPSTQEVSEVSFSGLLLQIHSAAFRSVAEPQSICSLDRSGNRAEVYCGYGGEASTQTSVVMKHLADLGFIINTEKSVLSSVQHISFLRLSLDSITFTARLSEERVKMCRACLGLFRPHKAVSFRLSLWPLDLVVQLGRLFMRHFQHWVASLPVYHGAWIILVRGECALVLVCLRLLGHVCLLSCQHSPHPLSLLKKAAFTVSCLNFACMQDQGFSEILFRIFLSWAFIYKGRDIS